VCCFFNEVYPTEDLLTNSGDFEVIDYWCCDCESDERFDVYTSDHRHEIEFGSSTTKEILIHENVRTSCLTGLYTGWDHFTNVYVYSNGAMLSNRKLNEVDSILFKKRDFMSDNYTPLPEFEEALEWAVTMLGHEETETSLLDKCALSWLRDYQFDEQQTGTKKVLCTDMSKLSEQAIQNFCDQFQKSMDNNFQFRNFRIIDLCFSFGDCCFVSIGCDDAVIQNTTYKIGWFNFLNEMLGFYGLHCFHAIDWSPIKEIFHPQLSINVNGTPALTKI
jgi:hypothetical protein